jgi:phage terminase large subunit GpA-like protein
MAAELGVDARRLAPQGFSGFDADHRWPVAHRARIPRDRPAALLPPGGGLLLTAGVDVQRDRLEASLWAWGQDRQSWLVEHRVLAGSPFEAAVWEELRLLLGETWRHASGHRLPVAMAAIDSGDGMTTAEVYAFVRRAGAGRAIAVKGQDGLRAAVGQPAAAEVRRNGRNGFRRLEWVKTRERNEALDCRVYARAAAAALGMDGWGDGRWTRMADALSLPAVDAPPPTASAEPAPSSDIRPRGRLAPRGGWLR